MSEAERMLLQELQNEFESEFGPDDYILVPSSGSSQKFNQSVKLVALRIASVLNSANRVNHYLEATEDDNWGLALPDFHVAGLGVLARAYLMQSKVVRLEWDLRALTQKIAKNKISYISFVPTQMYDLVTAGIQSPACVKKVFVGGGVLSPDIRKRAFELGWPLAETYGMTETSSMVAVREKDQEWFQLMNNVDVKVEESLLYLHCDSMLTATVQKNDKKIQIKYFDAKSWYATEDQVELKTFRNNIYLKLLGRKSDYIKILGEGVSLTELRSQLHDLASHLQLNYRQLDVVSIEDARAENQLVLIFESQVPEALRSKILNAYNSQCRAYEKITKTFVLEQIPRTDLGKLKSEELKRIIEVKG